MKNTFYKLYYYVRYGVWFEPGYEYQKIKHTDLDLLEAHHKTMLYMGWEQYTDVKANFLNVWCWYRRKKQFQQ